MSKLKKSRRGSALIIVIISLFVLAAIIAPSIMLTSRRANEDTISHIVDSYHYAMESAIAVAIQNIETSINQAPFSNPVSLASITPTNLSSNWNSTVSQIRDTVRTQVLSRFPYLINSAQNASSGEYNYHNIDVLVSVGNQNDVIATSNHSQNPSSFTVYIHFPLEIESTIVDSNGLSLNANRTNPIELAFNIELDVITIPGNDLSYFENMFANLNAVALGGGASN